MTLETSPARLSLPSNICETINFSMMTGMPIMVTYWDEKGLPNTSWRGSTHVHEDGRLAMWIRSRQGGLQKAIQTNPKIMMAFRNPHTKSFVTFAGDAALETSAEGNKKIYESSPPMEQAQDPQQLGIGLIVNLSRVAGELEGETILIEA